MSIALTPDDFHHHRVLKDGSFLVLALDRPEGTVVCKIAKEDNAKIQREIDRIRQLKERYIHLAKWMPASLGDGIIQGGVLGGRLFSLQEFVSGPTLSQWMQTSAEPHPGPETKSIIGGVVSHLLDHFEDHRSIDNAQGWFDGMIRAAFTRIVDIPLINSVARMPEILINGKRRRGLRDSVERIVTSDTFDRLIRKSPAISDLGHWNFHGENIILNSRFPDGFAVIDPDVSLDECDPVFGLARLLYTFPHDTAEHTYYIINSDLLMPKGNTPRPEFEIAFTWPESTLVNYRYLYRGVLDGEMPRVFDLDPRFANDARLWYRLNVSLLLCLLRGVSVNYKPNYPLHYGDMVHFQNEALFILLNAIELADLIAAGDNR